MGWSLRYSPEQGNLFQHFVALYMGDKSERGQCHCLTCGGFPGTHPISSYFTPFPYMTGAPLPAALVVVPRVGGFVFVLGPCGPFKCTLLRHQQSLIFQARSHETSFPGTGTQGCALWPGASSLPKASLLILSTICECGTACSTGCRRPCLATTTPCPLCPAPSLLLLPSG